MLDGIKELIEKVGLLLAILTILFKIDIRLFTLDENLQDSKMTGYSNPQYFRFSIGWGYYIFAIGYLL